jgi:uncharacterized membrane protein
MAGSNSEAGDRLKDASGELLKTLGDRAFSVVSDKMGGLTDRLDDVAGGGPIGGLVKGAAESTTEGKSPVGGALKGAVSGIKDKITGGGGGKGNKGGKATKATTILETIDVGVPIEVAYNQWTEFGRFPEFMKKVEKAEAEEETKINWKAQIVWSHRTWEATILEQVPEEKIVWRSKGQKGHVDGAVTFHEITPTLTRIIVVLEYYPQGLFERTGNIWRAQGRRVRAELLHFRRHVMTRTILNPDELEGWRGEIRDGEVVKSHEDALEEEQNEDEYDESEDQGDEDQGDEEYDEPEDQDEEYDEGSEDEPEDEADEGYEDEPEEEPEPEYESEDEAEEPEDEEYDESEDEADEKPTRSRRTRRAS